ncbi:hypothetical protein LTR46_008291 [Exophiala xenobiotica]|nr:hypothetical protein LTR46_008291 [Exophiala xenobiotica]
MATILTVDQGPNVLQLNVVAAINSAQLKGRGKTAKVDQVMGNKVHIYEHTSSYNAISHKSPQGLQCLKALFSEYDSSNPSRIKLNDLFTDDFHDNTNGSDRNTGRDETIDSIISSRAKCTRHQIDLKHAWCLENSGSSQTVFFEAVRFMYLDGDSDWTRIPLSGRIEVRVKENKFSLKDAIAQISSRRMTSDTSQLMRKEMWRASMPLSPAEMSTPGLRPSNSQLAQPKVSELPAARTLSSIDNEPLPDYRKSQSSKDASTRTPTVTSGSSVDAVEKP